MPYSGFIPEQVPETGIQGPIVQSPSFASEAVRHVARTGARVGETVVGAPADALQLLSSLANVGKTYLTGEPSPSLENIPYIPTAARIREYGTTPIAEKIAGKGYIDPQTEYEKVSDEVFGDLALLAIPFTGGVPYKGAIPLARAIKTAGFGNFVKQGSKFLGASEGTQEGLKAVTMVGMNLGGPKRLKEAATNFYAKAESALPPGTMHSATKIKPTIKRIEHLFKKGDLPTDWGKKITFIENSIKKGKVPIQEVIDINKDLNNYYYSKKPSAAFTRSFPKIKEGVADFLTAAGKENPTWHKNFTDANSLWTQIAKGEKVQDFMGKALSKGRYSMSTIAALSGYPKPLATMIGGRLATPIAQTMRILGTNKTAWNAWLQTILAAVKENAPLVLHNATKFEKILQKELKEEKPRTSGYSGFAPVVS